MLEAARFGFVSLDFGHTLQDSPKPSRERCALPAHIRGRRDPVSGRRGTRECRGRAVAGAASGHHRRLSYAAERSRSGPMAGQPGPRCGVAHRPSRHGRNTLLHPGVGSATGGAASTAARCRSRASGQLSSAGYSTTRSPKRSPASVQATSAAGVRHR